MNAFQFTYLWVQHVNGEERTPFRPPLNWSYLKWLIHTPVSKASSEWMSYFVLTWLSQHINYNSKHIYVHTEASKADHRFMIIILTVGGKKLSQLYMSITQKCYSKISHLIETHTETYKIHVNTKMVCARTQSKTADRVRPPILGKIMIFLPNVSL